MSSIITRLMSKRLGFLGSQCHESERIEDGSTSSIRPPTRKAARAATSRICREAETEKQEKIKTEKQKTVAKRSKKHAKNKNNFDQQLSQHIKKNERAQKLALAEQQKAAKRADALKKRPKMNY